MKKSHRDRLELALLSILSNRPKHGEQAIRRLLVPYGSLFIEFIIGYHQSKLSL
ncbi:hypothetical protein [Brevibacillus laterosporus]|uniref:hypothetical protein n=1 Tax=Brevibacillus laterosporus TaxID=1465 RepID=UPI003D201E50